MLHLLADYCVSISIEVLVLLYTSTFRCFLCEYEGLILDYLIISHFIEEKSIIIRLLV